MAAGLLQQSEEFADLGVLFERVPEGEFGVDLIGVAAADAAGRDVAFLHEVGDDALGGALGDADFGGNILNARFRILGDAQKHVGVVGEESPVHEWNETIMAENTRIANCVLQYMNFMSYIGSMNTHPVRITVAEGDGIGPEIMRATLDILKAAGAAIEPEFITIGEPVYLRGHSAGITADAWESLRRTRVFLKAPITTPQGGGYKSLNVTVRKTLGLYANVRPVRSYHPFVRTKHPRMDVVIVRENEEDLYAGIEHRQTEEVYQCLKIITRPGTEKLIRYAFEYARRNKRKKVACFTKDNIMKLTDGLFHKVFDEVAKEYPEMTAQHFIVDIGAALLADRPEDFDVIVTPNLYGDVISDIAAQIAGSVGLAGSSNIGEHVAMFEAIHGSAPTIAAMSTRSASARSAGPASGCRR